MGFVSWFWPSSSEGTKADINVNLQDGQPPQSGRNPEPDLSTSTQTKLTDKAEETIGEDQLSLIQDDNKLVVGKIVEDRKILNPLESTTASSQIADDIGENSTQARVHYYIPRGRVEELDNRRMQLLSIREQCRQERVKLQIQRERIEPQDQELLRCLYTWQSDPTSANHETLQRLLNTLVEERETLQHMESAYDEMELNLNRKEWELKEAESAVFSAGIVNDSEGVNLADLAGNPDSDKDMTEDIDEDSELAAAQPVIRDLLTRLAIRRSEAQQIEEQLFELGAEKADILERLEEDHRLKINHRPLPYDASQFLDTFDVRYAELEENLRQLTGDIFTIQGQLDDHNDILFSADAFDDENDGGDSTAFGQEHIDLDLHREQDDLYDGMEPMPSSVENIEDRWNVFSATNSDWFNNGYLFVNTWLRVGFTLSQWQLLVYKSCAFRYPNIITSQDPTLRQLALANWTTDSTEQNLIEGSEATHHSADSPSSDTRRGVISSSGKDFIRANGSARNEVDLDRNSVLMGDENEGIIEQNIEPTFREMPSPKKVKRSMSWKFESSMGEEYRLWN